VKVLVLKTVDYEMKSFGGFHWPESGRVVCPDWKPTEEYGNGLHGLLWGEGNGSLLSWEKDAKWLVLSVESDKIIDLGDKVKFPECDVVHCGDQKSATDYIIKRNSVAACAGAEKIGRDYSRVNVGDFGIATAGY
jgi:hypothetical protein